MGTRSENLREAALHTSINESVEDMLNQQRPRMWRRVSMDDLASTKFMLEAPVHEGTAEIFNDDGELLHNGRYMVFSDGTGVFVERRLKDEPQSRMTLRFYTFGCEHKEYEVNVMPNKNKEWQCKRCGNGFVEDTSCKEWGD
jgi:hypothetical protein